MKLDLLLHKEQRGIVPMLILSESPIEVAREIIRTSTHCQGVSGKFAAKKNKKLSLDPGGMYYMKTPHVEFDIDGICCDLQLTKIDGVLALMEQAKERVPGYMRFRMWMWNIVLPKSFFEKLKTKLEELNKQDEVLHAHLDEDAVRAKIEAECPYVRFNVPRE